jgi:DNA-binding ferritin-like protein
MNKELIADIRNKIQAAVTALELMSEGKEVTKEFIEMAKRELDEAMWLLARL